MPNFEFFWPSSDGLRLLVRAWEPDVQPCGVVCLVHGLGEHSGRYAHVADAMTAAGYSLMAFDLRGHGRSEGLRGHAPSYDRLLDDISGFLEEAAARHSGLPRFLYGHSLGGNLVLSYALRRKPHIAGVIASAPALRTAVPTPAVKVALGRVLCRVAPRVQFPNGIDRPGLSRNPEVVAAYGTDPLVHDRVSARLGVDLLQHGEWALAHAGDFPPLPLLLFHGTADRVVAVSATQAFAAGVPGECTLKLWDGLYHETHNEPEQAEVLATMVSWLREHTRPAL